MIDIPLQKTPDNPLVCEKCGAPNAHLHYAAFAPDDPFILCMGCDPAYIEG